MSINLYDIQLPYIAGAIDFYRIKHRYELRIGNFQFCCRLNLDIQRVFPLDSNVGFRKRY